MWSLIRCWHDNDTQAPIPAIEAIDLTKVYGEGHTEVVAVKRVRFGSPRRDRRPTGSERCRQVTLLTAMALINPPTSGRIIIGGEPVMDGEQALVDLRAFRRRHLGFVFQKANLIPFLNAVENAQVALEINDTPARVARQRAMELLDYLGVGNRAITCPEALSGGEQQRVAIACVLANKPSLVLADEPTAALDSQRGRQVMELFAKVAHERNAGVIVVTHDSRALDVFGRIVRPKWKTVAF